MQTILLAVCIQEKTTSPALRDGNSSTQTSAPGNTAVHSATCCSKLVKLLPVCLNDDSVASWFKARLTHGQPLRRPELRFQALPLHKTDCALLGQPHNPYAGFAVLAPALQPLCYTAVAAFAARPSCTAQAHGTEHLQHPPAESPSVHRNARQQGCCLAPCRWHPASPRPAPASAGICQHLQVCQLHHAGMSASSCRHVSFTTSCSRICRHVSNHALMASTP